MGKTYRSDELADPRITKQSAKLKTKQQGRQTKQFMRNFSFKQCKELK